MTDLRRITLAYAMAATAHAGQRRKGGDAAPYINHPCAVADLVAQAGARHDAVIAAVLHDVVEDTPISREHIAGAFGSEVAELVDWLTTPEDVDALPLADKKARQAAHIRGAPADARLIKLADQTSNLRDLAAAPDAWPSARRQAYLAGARQVADACRGLSPALERKFDAAAAALEAALTVPHSEHTA